MTSISQDALKNECDWTPGVTYSETVDGSGVLQTQTWTYTGGNKMMSIDYTYNADQSIATAVKKAYDTDGINIISQLRTVYSYSGFAVTRVCTREI